MAQAAELADGEVLLVTVNGSELLLACVGDQFLAADSVCTHALGYLDQGTLDGFEIQCPLHVGRFDLRTGAATKQPAVDPLTIYDVRVHHGTIYIGSAKSV